MSSTREIKRRIKSVGNIKQITRAMQLVATSKMKRAQKRSTDADAYAYGARDMLRHITHGSRDVLTHPYWSENVNSNTVGVILISTNRGFCGGMNVFLASEVIKEVEKFKKKGFSTKAISMGTKGRELVKKSGVEIVADFSDIGDHFTLRDIAPITRIVTEEYKKGAYRSINIAFTQFVNILNQKPIIRQILPITLESFEDVIEYDNKKGETNTKDETKSTAKYIFEPNIETTFVKLIPHLIEIQIYKAILENHASEHSARMVAMKNATEKAGELIDDLTLAYNQVRQAGITSEIAEISSGAMATA
jgi:F-type H+-transporting ATPase subunit gamma